MIPHWIDNFMHFYMNYKIEITKKTNIVEETIRPSLPFLNFIHTLHPWTFSQYIYQFSFYSIFLYYSLMFLTGFYTKIRFNKNISTLYAIVNISALNIVHIAYVTSIQHIGKVIPVS